MKTTKTQFRFFTVPEYEKEQEYLRGMHRQGWKLVRVGLPGIYHFEACQPQDVIYQLDYNREGMAQRENYLKLFSDCGWEYLFDFVGYSYFRRPADEADTDEIFCDDESRLEMMKRVFRGRMIPLIVIFTCLLLPQLVLRLSRLDQADAGDIAVIVVYSLLLVLYTMIFIQFTVQYLRYRRRVS